MAKCEELGKEMEPVYALANQMYPFLLLQIFLQYYKYAILLQTT